MPNSGLQNIYIMYGDSIPNYFNRRILFYGSLEDYLTAAGDNYELHEEVNFNPADGVNTYLDVVTDMGDKFSYLLLVDPEDGTILSRWFILEADRNLGGQYRFTLKRDVVAESFNNEEFYMNAPIYVEKSQLQDTDPLILNPEGMSFNQIKTSEMLLTEGDGNYGYIVGYYEKGASIANITIAPNTDQEPPTVLTDSDIATLTGIDLAKVQAMLAGTEIPFSVSDPDLTYGFRMGEGRWFNLYAIHETVNNDLSYVRSEIPFQVANYSEMIGHTRNTWTIGQSPFANTINEMIGLSPDYLLNAINDVIDNDILGEKYFGNKELSLLKSLEGQTISISGEYKTIHISSSGKSDHNEVVISDGENTSFDSVVSTICSSVQSDWKIYLNYKIQNVTIELQPYEDKTIKTKISSSAISLDDAPYSMFIIPFGTYYMYFTEDEITTYGSSGAFNKNTALRLAAQIARDLGAKLYDIQLLPYFPNFYQNTYEGTHLGTDDGYGYCFNLKGKTEHTNFEYILDENDDKIGIIVYGDVSNFSLTLNRTLTAQDEIKIESQCNFYRLCSPNYNGVFEFNLAKNGMSVNFFNVEATYKPYNPLIRISPEFKSIYGSNFIDGRGLICTGDFSLPIISDPWVTYQNNNKNFAAIFARDIQNLDVTQRQERIKENIDIVTGTVGGAGAGAVAGGKIGGGYGAIAGAIVGLGAGAAGGLIETKLGTERRAEAKDYAIDRFNMSLATIKALPDTLAKNSAFTIINKIYPFVEYYTCTDIEKEALRKKIQYDGMTVGRIDTVSSFSPYGSRGQIYFKGQLIRAEGLEEDTHYINALYEEIAKGVYI